MNKEHSVSDYILSFVAFIIIFLITFAAMSFMWIGAETLIVGEPNYDVVDQVVAACISLYRCGKAIKS